MADQDLLEALAMIPAKGASPTSAPIDLGDDTDILEAMAAIPAPQSRRESVASGVLTAANSALLGFGDEIGSGVNAAIDVLGGADFSDSYDSYLTRSREAMGQFATENPKTAIGLEIAGGFGTGALGAVRAGVLKGPTTLGRIVAGAKTGAVQGAASGFGYGEGGAEERLGSAAVGTALGTGIGAAGGGISALVAKAGKSKAANTARQYLVEKAQDETGAIGNFRKVEPKEISKAQNFILKIFEDASDDELIDASLRMEQAAEKGVPLTVFEALDVPQGYADAKAIRISRGGRNVAEEFLQDRRQGLSQRIGSILDDISPDEDIYGAGKKLVGSANEIVDDLKKARSNFSGPFYKKAVETTPIIESEKIDKILSLPNVQPILAEVRKNFPLDIPADLPDNHFLVLNQLKKGMDDKIAGLSGNEQAKNAAGALTEIKNQMLEEMDNYSPEYRDARRAHQAFSGTINWLKGSKFGGTKDAGLLEDIMNINTEKAKTAGTALMSKTPSQLSSIKEVFEIAGHGEELRAGIRSAFQNILDETNVGVRGIKGGSVVDKLFGKANTREKLVSLLGEDETDKLWQKIDLESYIDKGETLIGLDEKAVGAPTTMLAKTLGQQEGMLGKLMKSKAENIKDAVSTLSGGEKEELTREIAKRLYSTPDPKEFNALLRIQREYNKTARLAEKTAQAISKGSSKAGASSTSSGMSGSKNNKEAGAITPAAMAAVGGAGVAASQAPWASFLPEMRNNGTTEESETKRMGALAPSRNTPAGFMSNPDTGKPGALGGGKKNSKMNRTEKIKLIEQKIDQDPIDAAIYEVESARNPTAKNPKSTAAGGFQLLKGMQEALGVKDPYDLEQNYKGYRKLREENEARFGSDPRTLYSAHYLGATVLDKYLKNKPLSAKERAQVKYLEEEVLPRFDRIYAKVSKDKSTTNV